MNLVLGSCQDTISLEASISYSNSQRGYLRTALKLSSYFINMLYVQITLIYYYQKIASLFIRQQYFLLGSI